MYKRSSKVLLVWTVAFFVSLVVFNNLADYGSNYGFVGHVLKMDTTFPENRAMWRAFERTRRKRRWLVNNLQRALRPTQPLGLRCAT